MTTRLLLYLLVATVAAWGQVVSVPLATTQVSPSARTNIAKQLVSDLIQYGGLASITNINMTNYPHATNFDSTGFLVGIGDGNHTRLITPDQLFGAVTNQNAVNGIDDTSPRMIFVGDSLTYGAYGTNGPYTTYVSPPQWGGRSWTMTNIGISGATIHDIYLQSGTNIAPRLSTHGRNIVVLWIGTNSRYEDAPNAFDELAALCKRIHSFGNVEIILLTMIDRTGDFDDTVFKNAYNGYIKTYWRDIADGLVDMTQNDFISKDYCSYNLSFFNFDRIHLIDAGYATVGAIVNSYLLSYVPNRTTVDTSLPVFLASFNPVMDMLVGNTTDYLKAVFSTNSMPNSDWSIYAARGTNNNAVTMYWNYGNYLATDWTTNRTSYPPTGELQFNFNRYFPANMTFNLSVDIYADSNVIVNAYAYAPTETHTLSNVVASNVTATFTWPMVFTNATTSPSFAIMPDPSFNGYLILNNLHIQPVITVRPPTTTNGLFSGMLWNSNNVPRIYPY